MLTCSRRQNRHDNDKIHGLPSEAVAFNTKVAVQNRQDNAKI